MLTIINGADYLRLLDGGIRNLEKNKDALNDLNVFPVPDGDTGTNMVMTLKYGFDAVRGRMGNLSELSQAFATSAVFGARGNSGVIVSQFFKGLAEGFRDREEADSEGFALALESGCRHAYASVAKPVEGTMLTVVREAAQAVKRALPLNSIDEAVDIFLREAHVSLKNTPQLLPVLKKAGVVDSGGAGIVCFFEGVRKYLSGETVEVEPQQEQSTFVDLSGFSKDTVFEYGYCVEALLQLTRDVRDFDLRDFKKGLTRLGDSVVTTLEGDKVKMHVHAKKLSRVMDFCQAYGEFLTIKIENMTVQNLQKQKNAPQPEKFLYDREQVGEFAIVAVASNPQMQRTFFEMGAHMVILSDIAPSSQDFIDAFDMTGADKILVFPNSSNSILTCMQAASLYKNGKVTVLNSRSLAQCYTALAILDPEGTLDEAAETANETISGVFQLSIYQAAKDIRYGNKRVARNAFFALANNQILKTATDLEEVTLQTIRQITGERECYVVRLFYGSDIAEEYMEYLQEQIEGMNLDVEVAVVPAGESTCALTVTFE